MWLERAGLFSFRAGDLNSDMGCGSNILYGTFAPSAQAFFCGGACIIQSENRHRFMLVNDLHSSG